MNWSIQAPTNSQLQRIQFWLPQAFVGVPQPIVFAAIDRSRNSLCGAATLRMFGRDARFLVFVEPASRRQRCGALLMQYCEKVARESGAERLLAGQSLPGTHPDVAFFTALEFCTFQQRTRFEIDPRRMAEVLDPVCQRIERTQRWPSGCRFVALNELPVHSVAAFAAGCLGGFIDVFAARLQAGEYSLPTSFAVVRNGQVAGVLLSRAVRRQPGPVAADAGTIPLVEPTDPLPRAADLLCVDVIAVHKKLRQGTVATMMKQRLTQAALSAGFATITFEADEVLNPDTVRFARRCDARGFETRLLFGTTLLSGKSVDRRV